MSCLNIGKRKRSKRAIPRESAESAHHPGMNSPNCDSVMGTIPRLMRQVERERRDSETRRIWEMREKDMRRANELRCTAVDKEIERKYSKSERPEIQTQYLETEYFGGARIVSCLSWRAIEEVD
ncbi:hypothetical protein BDZ45DRAFT_222566 [Acephala macrosclerotiorum]|nr:hypothetical protein BDZ45DRAFT_222566 [Acephala macrosclerotiorum]